jgi:hypothetical protein
MPQASTAHDNFWDFISLVPESTHMIMWAMSDRAIPRSFRMMEGFGIHTFRFVNAEGKGRFVDPGRRRYLGTENTNADSAEATQRAEAVTLVARRLDRRVPVGLDPELSRRHTPAPLAGDEDDRNALESARSFLEQPLRIAGLHSADVDAADAYPGRDSRRRARED